MKRVPFTPFCNCDLEIISLGSDFVRGFVRSMDGEKDPRDLLPCFSTVTFILTQMPAAEVEEQLEVRAHYANQ